MSKYFLYTFLIIATFTSSCQTITPQEILIKTNSNIEKNKTIHYVVKYEIKRLSSDDTTKFTGEVWAEINKADTLLGYKVQLKKGEVHKIYTIDSSYFINHKTKKVTIYDPKRDKLSPIAGNSSKRLLFDQLILGIDTKTLQADSTIISFSEKKETKTHWLLQFNYKDSPLLSEDMRTIWINKKSFLPEKMTRTVKLDNQYQYTTIEVTELETNSQKIIDLFKNFKIPNGYKIEYHKPITLEYLENIKLRNGAIPPDFSINDMDGNNVTLSALKGKVVLLDFFYMACHPCVLSIPHISKLHANYNNKGFVVLAINPLDNDKEKLQKFIKEKEINHTILMAPIALAKEEYNLMSYPAFYLIGKDGTIVYSQLGYGLKTESILEEKVKEALGLN